MKSMDVRIKPEREYFCYTRHRIQFALNEVLGLKGAMRILVQFPRRKEPTLLHLWTAPGRHSSWLHIPSSSLPSQLLPWNRGIRNSGTFTAWACVGMPTPLPNLRFHFDVGDRIFMCTVEDSCLQRVLGNVLCSEVSPPGHRGIRWNHRHPAFQIPGPRIQHWRLLPLISPLPPFSALLGDTETITAFTELNPHSRLLV